MLKYLVTTFILISYTAYANLVGGRPNSFSEGQNAFAGAVNPANAVWLVDRFDLGCFLLHQKSTFDNRDNNPRLLPGKVNMTYKANPLFTTDGAIHKQFKATIGARTYLYSLSLASYTTPSIIRLRTKYPLPNLGTTPLKVDSKIEVLSFVFSLKLNDAHAIGISTDYYSFTRRRNGYQNSDNPQRSVSPGHVTNNGFDHSHGIGLTLGYRWNITKALKFGIAWTQKTYCGQYRRYRGFDPHHAENYIPQAIGGGFSYKFNQYFAGRLEVLWVNQGNLPGANNTILADGKLNTNKRGSNQSPGPGLQDATFINMGLGCRLNQMVSVGVGFSKRIKLRPSTVIISHSYIMQTIYDLLSLGANINYKKHDIYMSCSFGFNNHIKGHLPAQVGGGEIATNRSTASFSFSYGYKY